jgi:hypothetical protein
MKLKPCVDCGKQLSRTAKECGGCDSTDPFGKKRLESKICNIFLLIFFGVSLFMLNNKFDLVKVVERFLK